MPAAVTFFRNILKVKPAQEKLNLTTNFCGEAKIPESLKESGVDADLIVFASAKNDGSNGVLAWATPCLLDEQLYNRPYAGQVNFNINYLKTDAQDWESQLDTTLHEMTHIFAHNSALYQFFVDPNGQKWGIDNIKRTKTIRGVETEIIVTPTVVQAARDHFNCPTLEGAELENEGGSGSKGAHWERRVFYNEFMTASIMQNPAFSNMSMALLQDSGWYQPDFTQAEQIALGQNKGCSFLSDLCVQNKKAAFEEFCTDFGVQHCTNNHISKGACLQQNPGQRAIPEVWNYFADGSTSYDQFSDNCPFVVQYSNGDCRDPYNDLGSVSFQEKFGSKSYCFEGDYTLESYKFAQKFHTGCHEQLCTFNDTTQQYTMNIIIGLETVACQENEVNIEKTIPGYVGTIKCPKVQYICQQQAINSNCPNSCSGRGHCNSNNTCQCFPGWSGEDCNTQFCPDDCSGTDQGNCQSDGICLCVDGWSASNCATGKVIANCERCKSQQNTSCYESSCVSQDYVPEHPLVKTSPKFCWKDYCLKSDFLNFNIICTILSIILQFYIW